MTVGSIETMVPVFPGQKVNGSCGVAVEPIETIVSRLPEQKVFLDRKSMVVVVWLWTL